MSEATLTHEDLSRLLGVSQTTVKSYRRKFPGCIPVANMGKPIRFTAEAAKVATRIRDLFQTGMSVPETRARLAAEFDWISPDAPDEEPEQPADNPPDAPRQAPADTSGASAGPELSIGVSNMAKSMVEMSQKQNVLLRRMEGIEHLLGELGLDGGADLADIRDKSVAANRAREEKLESRLNLLEDATRSLADNVHGLASELSRLFAARSRELSREDAPTRAEVFNFRTASEAIRAAMLPDEPLAPVEPPREFLSLPLVVRSGEGRCANAAGRAKGRLSVNDFKALLLNIFMPPRHFTLRWEEEAPGWRLHMEQENGGQSIRMLLRELSTQNSGHVVEIVALERDGEELTPAGFSAMLDALAEQERE
jgi:hypothetical protein